MRSNVVLATGVGLCALLAGCQATEGEGDVDLDAQDPTVEEVHDLVLCYGTPDLARETMDQVEREAFHRKTLNVAPVGGEASVKIRFVHYVDRGKYGVTADQRAAQLAVLNAAYAGVVKFEQL